MARPAPRRRNALGVRKDLISPCLLSSSLRAPQPSSCGPSHAVQRVISGLRSYPGSAREHSQGRKLVHAFQVFVEQCVDLSARKVVDLDLHDHSDLFHMVNTSKRTPLKSGLVSAAWLQLCMLVAAAPGRQLLFYEMEITCLKRALLFINGSGHHSGMPDDIERQSVHGG